MVRITDEADFGISRIVPFCEIQQSASSVILTIFLLAKKNGDIIGKQYEIAVSNADAAAGDVGTRVRVPISTQKLIG